MKIDLDEEGLEIVLKTLAEKHVILHWQEMKSNKEIIDKLVEYFMTQDKLSLSVIVANYMIDFNRIFYLHKLDESEKINLQFRIEMIVKQLDSFVKNGPQGDIKITSVDS